MESVSGDNHHYLKHKTKTVILPFQIRRIVD